jgi:hypothetical protein
MQHSNSTFVLDRRLGAMTQAPVQVDYYRWLFEYSYWARDRVLAQLRS